MKILVRYYKLLLPLLLALLTSGLTQAAWAVTPQVRTGVEHTVMLRSDGTIWTTGSNASGQLGDGTNISRTTPVQIGLLGNATNWVAVATGDDHTLALKADGSLWAWGANQSGQIGDATTVNRAAPVRIGNANDYWTAVAAGESSSFAIKANGTLWAWGNNTKGQLGDTTTTARTAPVQVGTATNWVSLASGDLHVIALKADGSLWAWGANQSGQIAQAADTAPHSTPLQIIVESAPSDNDWSAVAAGGSSSFALKADGTLWAWGANDSGQLGFGAADATPHAVPIQVTSERDWTAISTGKLHTLAVKRNGSLWAWGDNTSGQLGDGTKTDRNIPTRISAPAGITDIVAVAAGAFHSVAAKANGELHAWGDNGIGQLGNGTALGTSSPVLVGVDEINWVATEPGGEFTVGRRSNGTLWSWGDNASGQLGDDTLTSRTAPVMVGTSANWVAQAAGWGHTVALQADGTLWTWGDNTNGQLGDGTSANRQTPQRISAANSWSAVAAGDFHTLALQADGTLWAWGDNTSGQLGDGTNATSRMSPVQIVTGNPGNFDRHWVAIAAGGSHSLALQADGTLWVWGDNGSGQLGISGAGINTPQQIFNLSPPTTGWNSNWTAIAAGLDHSLALQADGTLWSWGSNFSGKLGDGTVISRTAPVQVGLPDNSTNWVTIAAGDSYSVARRTDGSLWSWGNNTHGQLGNGVSDPIFPAPTVPHPSPEREMSNAGDWVAAGSGGSHTVALKASGILWGWGNNAKGQLGDATTTDRNIPAPLVEMRIDAAPATIAFGSLAIGASSAQTITISNSGTAPLQVNGLNLSGVNSALFTVTMGTCGATPFTVAASRSCFVNIAFNPALPAEAKSATLTITSNDPITQAAKVNLSATAVAPFVITASVTAGNGAITPSGAVLVLPGSSQAFAITPNTGFHVADVTVNGVSKGAVNSVTLPPATADATVTASFAVNNYAVTINAGANGAITGPTTANHGDLPVYAITPNPGYHVVDVTVDGNSIGAPTTVTLPPLIASAEITATFAINTYTITMNAAANSLISGPATANHGESPVYAITPDPGYHVVDVMVDGVSKGSVTSLTLPAISSNTTITALVDINSYTINTSADSRGTIAPAGNLKVKHGANQAITFTPNAGYNVVNVLVDGVSKGPLPSYSFTNVTSDSHTIKVVFIPDGDLNNDGQADIADAIQALKISVGLVAPAATDLLHGDTAPLDAGGIPVPDNKLSVEDALQILRKVVGLTSGW